MTYIKLDLHVHTVYSKDAFIKPKDLIKDLKEKGLDGCAIVDHGNLKAYHSLKNYARQKNIILIPGIEIETHIGEVIGLFLEKQIKFEEKENFFSVIKKIKQAKGLVIIPHPFDILRRNHLKIKLLNGNNIKNCIDGVEVMNSRILIPMYVKKAKIFQRKHNLFEVGGSDAHTLNELGNGYTIIRLSGEKTMRNIKKSLLLNQSISCGHISSPFVHIKTIAKKFLKGMYF